MNGAAALYGPADVPGVEACRSCGGDTTDGYGRACGACGGSGVEVEPVGSGSAGGVEGHAAQASGVRLGPTSAGGKTLDGPSRESPNELGPAGFEPGPALPPSTDPDAWMDQVGGPAPNKWDLARERIAAEGMWQPGVWIERSIELEVYHVVEVEPPALGPRGPVVTRRPYVSISRAQHETEKRCLISAWLPDGPRLVGYRAPSWRRPSR